MDACERLMHPSPGLGPASPRERRKGARAADAHGCTNAVERKCCTGMCECRGRRCCTWTCECRGRRDALERRCAGAADAPLTRTASGLSPGRGEREHEPHGAHGCAECRGSASAAHGCAGAADAPPHPDCVRPLPRGRGERPPLPLRERVGVRGRAAVRALQTNSKT
jgi:hypothetical protein